MWSYHNALGAVSPLRNKELQFPNTSGNSSLIPINR